MAELAEESMFKGEILGHKSGLFVLFFTEMWERFSFYGMRVLLVNFLTMAIVGYNPGWDWDPATAGALFGTYAMLLYLTPILGGIIADKITGYRGAVVVGAILMTAGHAAMALETELGLYLGLGLLVLGTGFFKPNMTSILSQMYDKYPKKKDGAYTIFYMGVNAGAFFGMMLCGYLAEKIGWSWGFGLAGIFMLLGTLQFWLAKPLFGKLGDRPIKTKKQEELAKSVEKTEKRNPFTPVDIILTIVASVIGLGYAINDPMSKIAGVDMFSMLKIGSWEGQYVAVVFAILVFLYLVISRTVRYEKAVRWKMWAVMIFAFFTVFFWMSFEQGASSLVIFARDGVERNMTGGAAIAFNVVNTLLTVVPLIIVSWVLYLLWKNTFKKIAWSNIVLVVCFLGVWGIVGWMLNRELSSTGYDVELSYVKAPQLNDQGVHKSDNKGNKLYSYVPVQEGADQLTNTPGSIVIDSTITISEIVPLTVGQEISLGAKTSKMDSFGFMDEERLKRSRETAELNKLPNNGVIPAKVTKVKGAEVEITTSWFSILNSFFIIALASFFSKWWESKYNPPAAAKYGLGLIIMAIGFGFLAFGSYGVANGIRVSMVWLVLAYFFHTAGELCSSPVGLSYVSKLVPPRMIAFMFGMWYLAIAIGNKSAATLGGMIESISEKVGMSGFFLIFTIVPLVAGVLVWLLNPVMKKLMQEVE